MSNWTGLSVLCLVVDSLLPAPPFLFVLSVVYVFFSFVAPSFVPVRFLCFRFRRWFLFDVLAPFPLGLEMIVL